MSAVSAQASAVGHEPLSTDVAIVGSGFSGLGMAIRLEQQGRGDFVVLERDDDVGGTWLVNTYPGCACDVPSHLYSYSFAPNPDWSETYSRQPEIRDYLRRCADRFGVRERIHFGRELTGAAWDDAAGRWELETSDGPLTARVLISATGPLFEPKIPDLPGLDSFAGTSFHSARWEHDHDLSGRSVAVIGTGASAIQLVPQIQPQVERLHVFQRTPPWVVPHSSRPISDLERRLYRTVPALQRLVRGAVYATREALVLGFAKNPRLMRVIERTARRHIDRAIEDPELRAKVTPDYTIGCKRILPSNDWYRALAQSNVELVTDPIGAVRPTSLATSDGRERPVDTIIFGTGFHVTDQPVASRIEGRDGVTLDEIWQGSPHAYLGTSIAGFPNLFMLLGPNTGLGHTSMVYMIESQINYVLDALRVMDERGASTAELDRGLEATYNASLDEQLEGTVWNTGCASWYVDATGRNSTIWPDWTWRFRLRTRRFEPRHYELRTARAPAAVAA